MYTLYDRLKRHIPFIYFVLIAIILFASNGRVSLWDQDEAAYAGFAKQMVESGNWSVPEFMWSEIHRKPPLHFWNIALSYKLFGINEFSVRFPSALFVLLTYLLIYLAGTPLFGKKTAFLGTVVLSTTLFIPSLAKVSVTDATLLFFSTLCAFAVLYVLEKRSFRWAMVFWASFALALLTKGPPVIMFTAVLCGILFIFHPNRKNLLMLHPWFFLPLACIPLFGWGYYVSRNDGGEFIQWMVDWYILKRVKGSVLGQTGPPGTHLLGLLVFFLPYFMFFPKAFWNSVSGIFQKYNKDIFFLSAWFLSGWFLYEWTPSKLPAYVVVAHVPLALLIGKRLGECMDTTYRPAKALAVSHFILMGLIGLALFSVPVILRFSAPIQVYFAVTGILLLISMTLIFYRFRSAEFGYRLIGLNLFFQIAVWIVLLPQVDKLRDASREVADYIEKGATSSSTVFIANSTGRPPSLPFYLSLNFENIQEENNIEMLTEKFQSADPCVLILDKVQSDSAAARLPEMRFKEITSMLSDRSKKVQYFIAINQSAGKSLISSNKIPRSVQELNGKKNEAGM